MTPTNFIFPPPPPPPPPPSSNFDSHPSSLNQGYSSNGYDSNSAGGQYAGRSNSSARAWPPRGSRNGASSGYSNLRMNGQHLITRGGYINRYSSQSQSYPNGAIQFPSQHFQAQQVPQNGYEQHVYGLSHGSYDPLRNPTIPRNPCFSNNESVQAMLNAQNTTNASPNGSWYGSERQSASGNSWYNTNQTVIGPPTRVGYERAGRTKPVQPYGQASSQGTQQNSTSIENNFSTHQGSSSMRTNSATFGSPLGTFLEPLVPPSVPGAGAPLRAAYSVGLENVRKPRKKRKHNQLGLTPKTEDHESSEEEDVDEESKLAAVQHNDRSSNPGQLQFLYKGRLATLNSPSEIAAWIEERKKRYPTRKRMEEEARRREQLHQAERNAAELRKVELKRQKVAKEVKHKKPDYAIKAKQKAEKLRKQYEKAQRQVAEMEAKESEANIDLKQKPSKSHPSLPRTGASLVDISPMCGPDAAVDCKDTSESTAIRSCLDSTTNQGSAISTSQLGDLIASPQTSILAQQPCFPRSTASPLVHTAVLVVEDQLPRHEVNFPEDNLLAGAVGDIHDCDDLDDSLSLSSSEVSTSTGDDTSSSGSSSESNSPAVVTSRRPQADRVIPEKTKKNKTICKLFLTKGYCPRADNCHYLHELPKRGSRRLSNAKGSQLDKTSGTGEVKKERITLHERMLAQQQDREDEILLQHIIFLGEHRILDRVLTPE